MKALTIHPLFACGIAFGLKTIELRTWKTDFRGDIIITSSSKKLHDTIPGHALCIAELHDIRKAQLSDVRAAMTRTTQIDPETDYAWLLRNIRLIKPVPIKGRLSLWNCDLQPEIIMTLDEYLSLSDEEDEKVFNQYWASLYV